MTDNFTEYVCKMCGATLENCRSWVPCRFMKGYVCTSCHCKCIYCDNRCSIGGCSLAWKQKYDRSGGNGHKP